MMFLHETTSIVLAKAIEVHTILGPGLLESAYKKCFFYELQQACLPVQKEVSVPLIYKDIRLDHGYRIDILIGQTIVIELKVVENLTPVHQAQVITYLRLGKYPVGLLINFNVLKLKDGGIKRFIL